MHKRSKSKKGEPENTKPFKRVKRGPDWERGLNSLIDSKRKTKFKWGQHDCFTFAVEAMRSIGVDHDVIKDFRGKYKTTKEASKIIASYKDGMKGLAHSLLKDYPQLRLQSAKRGDIVLVQWGKKQVMGVCVGASVACLGPDGLEFVSLKHAITVWGIGHK